MMQYYAHFRGLVTFCKDNNPYRPFACQVEVPPFVFCAESDRPSRLAVVNIDAYKWQWRHRMNALNRTLGVERATQHLISADEVLQRTPNTFHARTWRGSVAQDNAQFVPRARR
jgi:hypothetical protein